MAKQKRKESEVAEKKSKKLKKVSAVEMPAACAAPPGPGTAPAEGSASASLSPEEQRVLERKRKKERKKEARRRLREAGVAAAPSPAVRRSGAALALQYLRRILCGRPGPHQGEAAGVSPSAPEPPCPCSPAGPRSTRTGGSRRRGRPGCCLTCMTAIRCGSSPGGGEACAHPGAQRAVRSRRDGREGLAGSACLGHTGLGIPPGMRKSSPSRGLSVLGGQGIMTLRQATWGNRAEPSA
ncbi:uncharacterized protein C7orf50 homolog isoform X6 [Ovis aries]|nr:uncharacterized protein C7orf50 homolog isoform X6 [Ovis aries]XP_060262104.1 uncharacterized protein C7orf50 homolog isoform X6 [Ovis aries]